MHVLGIDPGKTTGICLLERIGFDDETNKWDLVVHQADQLDWDHRFDLEEPIRSALEQDAYVIVEQYTLRPTYTAVQEKDIPSAQVIGIIEDIMHHFEYPPDRYFTQPASARKNVRLLKGHGPLVKGAHARDAYRHARYFIVTKSNQAHQARKAAKAIKAAR